MRPRTLTRASFSSTAESELVRRALARDETAVRAILQANNRRLFRIARGILRDDSDAEDAVQETYIRALTHLDGFRGESSPLDLALADCHERGDGPATQARTLSHMGVAVAGKVGGRDHSVSCIIARSGKIHGPT
jgi:hypothetical protein